MLRTPRTPRTQPEAQRRSFDWPTSSLYSVVAVEMTHEAEYARAKAMVEQIHMGIVRHLGVLKSSLPVSCE